MIRITDHSNRNARRVHPMISHSSWHNRPGRIPLSTIFWSSLLACRRSCSFSSATAPAACRCAAVFRIVLVRIIRTHQTKPALMICRNDRMPHTPFFIVAFPCGEFRLLSQIRDLLANLPSNRSV